MLYGNFNCCESNSRNTPYDKIVAVRTLYFKGIFFYISRIFAYLLAGKTEQRKFNNYNFYCSKIKLELYRPLSLMGCVQATPQPNPESVVFGFFEALITFRYLFTVLPMTFVHVSSHFALKLRTFGNIFCSVRRAIYF